MFIVCNADQTGATEPGGGGSGEVPPPHLFQNVKKCLFSGMKVGLN